MKTRKSKSSPMIRKTAKALTNIALDHLATLPPTERKKKISAFRKAVERACGG